MLNVVNNCGRINRSTFTKIVLSKNRLYTTDLLCQETKKLDIKQLYFSKITLYEFINMRKLQTITHQSNTRHKFSVFKYTDQVGDSFFCAIISLYLITPKSFKILRNIILAQVYFWKTDQFLIRETFMEILYNFFSLNGFECR